MRRRSSVGFALVVRPASAAIEDRPPREGEPTQDRDAGQQGRNQVTEQRGRRDGTSKGREVRGDVVGRGDESLVGDVGDRDERP
jgi:hypothetical protein